MIIILLVIIQSPRIQAEPRIEFVRSYGDAGYQDFRDIYAAANGDLVICGKSAPRGGRLQFDSQAYVVRTDGAGNEIWTRIFGSEGVGTGLYTVIELDNGDLAVGGGDSSRVMVARITGDGNLQWMKNYETGHCEALIELKNGDLALAGCTYSQGNYNGILMRINPDEGQVVWQHELNDFASSWLFALKETNAGIVSCGWVLVEPHSPPTKMFLGKFSIENGDPIWQRLYDAPSPPDRPYDVAFSMISHPRGFVLSGIHNWDHVDAPSKGLTRMVNSDGEVIWLKLHDLAEHQDWAHQWYGVCRLPNGDIVQAGIAGWGSNNPVVCWMNSAGGIVWDKVYSLPDLGNFVDGRGYFQSVVTAGDGSIIACGSVRNIDADSSFDGFILKLEPLVNGPRIYLHFPQESILRVLRNDTVRFTVGARDVLDREIKYLWLRNALDTLAADSTVRIPFPEVRLDTIDCVVSSGGQSSFVRWQVDVRDLFLVSHSPDTLALSLRRGTTQTFSLDSVAAVEGDSVQYQWTLRKEGEEGVIDAGDDSGVTVDFLRSGNYRMEGVVFRGESSDNVVWTIAVRSAILDFMPSSLSLSVLADSLVNFDVYPFNPESDSLKYRWEVDGDSVGGDWTVGLRFAWNGQAGRSTYAVAAIVMDGAEGDTVTWTVNVQDPNGVGKWTSGQVDKWEVLSASPNPFNSSTTIHFTVPSASAASSAQSASSAVNSPACAVRLTLHDLNGREVMRLIDGRAQQAGPYAVTLNGANLPAGIYLLKLDAGGRAMARKVVLMK